MLIVVLVISVNKWHQDPGIFRHSLINGRVDMTNKDLKGEHNRAPVFDGDNYDY